MSIAGIAFDVTEFRFFTVTLATLQLYDYSLTLPDEIQCGWRGHNWIFFLFLFNRYVPLIYQLWSLFATFWSGYTQAMCNHSAFIHMFACVVFTLLSQIVLTTRVYAVTLKQRLVTGIFVIATVLQFGLGAFMTYLAIKDPAHSVYEVGSADLHTCIYRVQRKEETAYAIFALLFDVGVFLVIMNRLLWRRPSSIKMPFVVQTIVRDATFHVLLLSTSRLIFVLLSILTTSKGHITRFAGNTVFASIMTTRMLLSLKRTVPEDISQGWVVDVDADDMMDPPSTPRIIHGSVRFSFGVPQADGNTIPIPMKLIHVKDKGYFA